MPTPTPAKPRPGTAHAGRSIRPHRVRPRSTAGAGTIPPFARCGNRPWIVNDELWALIELLLPPWPQKAPGPKPVDNRLCLQAILYVLRNDISRQPLPNDVAPGPGPGPGRRHPIGAGKPERPRRRSDTLLSDQRHDGNPDRHELRGRPILPVISCEDSPYRGPGQAPLRRRADLFLAPSPSGAWPSAGNDASPSMTPSPPRTQPHLPASAPLTTALTTLRAPCTVATGVRQRPLGILDSYCCACPDSTRCTGFASQAERERRSSSTAVTLTSSVLSVSKRKVQSGSRAIRRSNPSRSFSAKGGSRTTSHTQSLPVTWAVTRTPYPPRQVNQSAHHSNVAGPCHLSISPVSPAARSRTRPVYKPAKGSSDSPVHGSTPSSRNRSSLKFRRRTVPSPHKVALLTGHSSKSARRTHEELRHPALVDAPATSMASPHHHRPTVRNGLRGDPAQRIRAVRSSPEKHVAQVVPSPHGGVLPGIERFQLAAAVPSVVSRRTFRRTDPVHPSTDPPPSSTGVPPPAGSGSRRIPSPEGEITEGALVEFRPQHLQEELHHSAVVAVPQGVAPVVHQDRPHVRVFMGGVPAQTVGARIASPGDQLGRRVRQFRGTSVPTTRRLRPPRSRWPCRRSPTPPL